MPSTAYRIREEIDHRLDLSFTARIGTLLVGSVRLTPIRIGETPALLLGPLTIEPPFRDRGIGQALIERALAEAQGKGHRLVVLVGDEPYYGKCGLQAHPEGAGDHAGSGRSGAPRWSPSWSRARSADVNGTCGPTGTAQ